MLPVIDTSILLMNRYDIQDDVTLFSWLQIIQYNPLLLLWTPRYYYSQIYKVKYTICVNQQAGKGMCDPVFKLFNIKPDLIT